jgi:hypothetical protein
MDRNRVQSAAVVPWTFGLLAGVTLLMTRAAPAEPSSSRPAQQAIPATQGLPPLIRSAQNGPWSAPTTWEGGKVPGDGARVQIRTGHRVVYDLSLPLVDRTKATCTFSPALEKSSMVILLPKRAPGWEWVEPHVDALRSGDPYRQLAALRAIFSQLGSDTEDDGHRWN